MEEFILFQLITYSLKPEVCLERCQTSKMEHFAKRKLFSRNTPSEMFDRLPRTPLETLNLSK